VVDRHEHFDYHKSMIAVDRADAALSRIAAAIGEPARARILLCLMDGQARSCTELAMVAGVSPSTASVHLNRLRKERLLVARLQGKHRFYRLAGQSVASLLEGLSVVAGGPRRKFVPSTTSRLRRARTCYDHMAGMLGVTLHDRFTELGWLSLSTRPTTGAYDLTAEGSHALEALGIDIAEMRSLRRRFACACLDWSERRPHIGGALGAALLNVALKRKWVIRDLDSRALGITALGQQEMRARFGLGF
jgi:DNA-binding transcriptional ArsR family regulator